MKNENKTNKKEKFSELDEFIFYKACEKSLFFLTMNK